jgi:hypothetical protein
VAVTLETPALPPLPLPEPQAEPVLEMNPESSTCKQFRPLLAARPGNLIAVVPVKLAYKVLLLPP